MVSSAYPKKDKNIQMDSYNFLYKIYNKNGYKWNDYRRLNETTVLVTQVIAKRKDYQNIIDSKVNNPETSAKAYWSILKTLYNGRGQSSVPSWMLQQP